MTVRIGFSGTNWTRKTTTINRLVKAINDRPVKVIALSDFVRRCPYPMGQDQTLDASRWMLDQLEPVLRTRPPSSEIQVFDRTPLDVIAFTLYAADRCGKRASIDVTRLIDAIREIGAQIDLVFLCRPNADWPSPERPSEVAQTFARQIDHYFTEALYLYTWQVLEMPWSVERRLSMIVTYLPPPPS